MNVNETIFQMEGMRLRGMADRYKAILSTPLQDRPTSDMMIAQLVEAERLWREQKKTERFLRASKLRYDSVLADVVYGADRNLTREAIAALSDCGFIMRAENVLIDGKTGCGKSYLACALGRQACMMGYRAEYFQMGKFIERIAIAKMEGTMLKLITHITKNDLVIFDDFGLQPLDNNSRLALLQIMEDLYERKSVIVTSQLPVSKWHEYINEPTIADAIMDRLTANAHRIELKGQSMRTKKLK